MRTLRITFVVALLLGGVTLGEEQRAEVSASLDQTALKAGSLANLAIEVRMGPGMHAQSSISASYPLTVTLDANSQIAFDAPRYPPGKNETYPSLGTISVYSGRITIVVPLKIRPDAKPGPIRISGEAHYQICDNKGTCFMPEDAPFAVNAQVVPGNTSVMSTNGATPASTSSATTTATPPHVISTALAPWSLGTALAAAFLAGILFNIVPCVLPVLPIKVMGFVEVAQHGGRRAVWLSLAFAMGVVAVFGVLSVFVVALGSFNWGQQFSNPYFAWGLVIVLLILSLWMFGIFNFNLPAGVYSVAPRHDTYFGNFLWGILTAILSTPCTGPYFVGAIAAATQLSTTAGVLAMLTVGAGMGSPYVLLAAFPNWARRFPRTGPWSELVKQMMGFVLLAFTVFFAAGRFTSPAGQWWATVPVAVLASLYLMARTVQISRAATAIAVSGVLSVAMMTSLVVIAARFSGVFDAAPAQWIVYSDQSFEAARATGKTVLVKFTANWCLNCQAVELNVFHDGEVLQTIRNRGVVLIKADLTGRDAPGWKRLKELSPTGGIPLTAIYQPYEDHPLLIDSVYSPQTLLDALANDGQPVR